MVIDEGSMFKGIEGSESSKSSQVQRKGRSKPLPSTNGKSKREEKFEDKNKEREERFEKRTLR